MKDSMPESETFRVKQQRESLEPFFQPQGVAVIGASQNPEKLGFGLARNLIQSDYKGAIHFVNPRGGALFNHPIYESISAVPDPVDLAIILIPARFIPQVLVECGQRGVRAVIIAAGGFREIGPDGAALEEECLRVAKEHQLRLMGPNCIGILDTHLPLDTTFLPPPGPTPGNVAFVSHSGAICAAVVDWARGQGFGLSRLVSLGNQVDVNETDVLAPVAADPYTRVITLYLEGVSDGRRFVREAQRISQQKPIVALKVGRFESGQQAVASHTGALAGKESAFNAAFRSVGVIRANSSEELFDWARALAWCPAPQGRNVAVLTNAGGPGVTAADALEAHGLQLVRLQEETQAALRDILPSAASVHNPVDMLAGASPEHYATCLRHLLADPGVHSILVILPPPPVYSAGGVARAMIPIINTAQKPVVIALMGERMIQEAVEYFRAGRVPEYRFPERAARALAILTQRSEFLSREPGVPIHFDDIKPDIVEQALVQTNVEGSGFLSQELCNQIMTAYGIRIPRIELTQEPDQAAEIANQMGYPVALKVASPDIPHKSDIDGILLNLHDATAVQKGFTQLIQRARVKRPNAKLLGVHVQEMISQGQEVIVGVVQDPQFGPLVMFGSGGLEVEGLKDVKFALAPLSRQEGEYLLENTWAGQKLRGYRHVPPADREAVLEAMTRLAQLSVDFPQLHEIEINPLRVLSDGKGVYGLDVRIKIA